MKAIRAAFATTGDDCRQRGLAGRRAVTSGGCGQPPFLDFHQALAGPSCKGVAEIFGFRSPSRMDASAPQVQAVPVEGAPHRGLGVGGHLLLSVLQEINEGQLLRAVRDAQKLVDSLAASDPRPPAATPAYRPGASGAPRRFQQRRCVFARARPSYRLTARSYASATSGFHI